MAIRERVSIFARKDAKFIDNVNIRLGSGTDEGKGTISDVNIRWDGTDLDMLAAVDDTVWKIGDGTLSFDVWIYGNTASDYLLWTASTSTLSLEGSATFTTGITTFPDGSESAPSITFTGDTNSGLFQPADNNVGITANGSEAFRINATGVVIIGNDEGEVTAPTGNTLRAPDIATGGAGNIAGADFTLSPGLGTGTGDVGTLILSLPIEAAAGDNIHTRAASWTWDMVSSASVVTLTLNRNTLVSGTFDDLGIVTTVDLNGGTIDGTAIGGASAAAGTFTTIVGTSLATSAATPLLLTNGQLVNVALTSQTVGATTLTIPDFASVADEFTFKTLAQTMSNKTFVAPALGTPASGVVTNLTGTASINVNGTVGAGTPAAGSFTTITGSGNFAVTDVGPHVFGGAAGGGYQWRLTGAWNGDGSGFGNQGMFLDPDITATVGANAAILRVQSGTIAEAASGTHGILATAYISEPDIQAGAAAVTNAVTVYIQDAPSEGTNNYALWIASGSFRLDGSLWVEGTPTEGAAGEQLSSAGAGAVPIWAAAASVREVKRDIEVWDAPKDALDTILNTRIYTFRYDPQRRGTTGDVDTRYVGPMADEAPWAMHHEGRILNPINTFGYSVLAVQALNDEITRLNDRIKVLEAA